MTTIDAAATRNAVLSSLSPTERAAVLAALDVRRLPLGTILSEAGESIEHVWFPVDAVASMVAEGEDGSSVEVAGIGWDGLVGAEIFLGVRRASRTVLIQVEGDVLVGSAASLHSGGQEAELARVARRYAHTLMSQASQGVLCNKAHALEQRAARWLLTMQDRVQGPRFHLTHEYFATLLGSHRPSVTIAAGMLQKAGFIRYTRGELEVLDREGLLAVSCECYGVVLEQYQSTMHQQSPPVLAPGVRRNGARVSAFPHESQLASSRSRR
jgi:CRP-like cAMP-binding protein